VILPGRDFYGTTRCANPEAAIGLSTLFSITIGYALLGTLPCDRVADKPIRQVACSTASAAAVGTTIAVVAIRGATRLTLAHDVVARICQSTSPTGSSAAIGAALAVVAVGGAGLAVRIRGAHSVGTDVIRHVIAITCCAVDRVINAEAAFRTGVERQPAVKTRDPIYAVC